MSETNSNAHQMSQNNPTFAQRCEALANNEKACHETYNNQYHKVRAKVGFDHWRSVWRFLLTCALPTLLMPEGEQELGALEPGRVAFEKWLRTVYRKAAGLDVEGWTNADVLKPLESDGEVLVLMPNGRAEFAWATYWHGASNDFARWTFRDPDVTETPTHWRCIPRPAPSTLVDALKAFADMPPCSEAEALRDMLDDARVELDMLREALGVPVEPHQTLRERTLEAAMEQRTGASRWCEIDRRFAATKTSQADRVLQDLSLAEAYDDQVDLSALVDAAVAARAEPGAAA